MCRSRSHRAPKRNPRVSKSPSNPASAQAREGIGKVSLLRLLHPHRETDTRRERWLLVRNEQPLEDVQVGRHGIGVNVLVVHRLDILHQHFISDGSTLISSQKTQQQTHLLGISLHPVNSVHIIVNDDIHVLSREQHCLLQQQTQAPRPSAPKGNTSCHSSIRQGVSPLQYQIRGDSSASWRFWKFPAASPM